MGDLFIAIVLAVFVGIMLFKAFEEGGYIVGMSVVAIILSTIYFGFLVTLILFGIPAIVILVWARDPTI